MSADPQTIDPQRLIAEPLRWRWGEVVFWLTLLLPYWLAPTYLSLASQIAIAALFALSLDLILGYAGIISLGHAAFFGVGAYTAAVLVLRAHWLEPFSGLVISGLAAAVLGWLTSFLIVRVSKLALLMVTLGVGVLLAEAANRLSWLTGGNDGLHEIDVWPLLGRFTFDLYGRTAFFYALAVLFLMFLGARRLIQSPFGLSLRGLRENMRRMPALGAPIRHRQRVIYTIAAFYAGVAGALLTQTTQSVALEAVSFQRSAEILIMLVLGGTGRLYGGIVGAILFLVARDQLADMNPQYWFFWLGGLLVLVVLFLPGGIVGSVDRFWRWIARRR
ncbi:MAG TPA: branched-chain amino acid ABC transporter permease [Stellaceae bacterium]|nr:branched-chain amino acid ABC transporter permease [Stellaceae bacterium]